MFRIRGNGQRPSVLVEILMIVIGINLALWAEGWFQDLENAEIEARYLGDLREDLLTDIKSLENVIRFGESKLQQTASIIEGLPEIANLPPQDLAQAIYTPPKYQFFAPSDFTYKSMQDSGDFRLLRSTKIKKSILKLDRRHRNIALSQQNYLQALDDSYIPLMMASFDIATLQITDPSFLQDQLFRNFFVYTQQDTEMMVSMYRLARSDSESLIKLIEAQLDI